MPPASPHAQLLTRIRKADPGKVFTPKDFLDLGPRTAIDQALSRLTRSGHLARAGRGLYHLPSLNPRLGIPIPPDLDDMVRALARRTGSRLVPSGAVAANRLGLTSQVPSVPIYLSDGRSRRVRIDNYLIHIKHAAPKDLPDGDPTSVTVLQALRFLGPDAIDDDVLRTLRRRLTPRQRRRFLQHAKYASAWIADAARRLNSDELEDTRDG